MNTDSYLLGMQRPIVITDRFRQIQDFAFDGRMPSATTEFFANDGYSNAVGKRVLCRAQWLTGRDRNICGAQILAKCGRKPKCVGIVSKKCKARKAEWLKCAQAVSFVPNPADTMVDTGTGSDMPPDTGAGDSGTGAPEKEGMDMNTKIAIGAGIGLLILGGAVALIVAGKNKKARMMQTAPVGRR